MCVAGNAGNAQRRLLTSRPVVVVFEVTSRLAPASHARAR
jgi:hypothetical protein